MDFKILLFDLDNTLLDFSANEAHSLPLTFEQCGYKMTEEMRQTYERINRQLWKDYEDRKIPMETILKHRFADTMKEFGIEIDGLEWNEKYLDNLSKGNFPMKDVETVIPALAKKYRLFIASNGVRSTQENRMKMAGIYDYFEEIFTSRELGVQKPDAAFFERVMEAVPDFDKSKTLMVGDSLKNDIEGAKTVGLATCMIKAGDEQPEACDYLIHELTDLLEFL